eukprot:6213833-Pyramimonas_sp.AAC.1
MPWLGAVCQLADPTEHDQFTPADIKIFFCPPGQVAIDLSELAVNDEVAVSSLAAAAPVAPKPKAPAAKPSREKKAAEQVCTRWLRATGSRS